MLSKENRFSEGYLPADTTEKVLEVEDGIVTKKEVDGKHLPAQTLRDVRPEILGGGGNSILLLYFI